MRRDAKIALLVILLLMLLVTQNPFLGWRYADERDTPSGRVPIEQPPPFEPAESDQQANPPGIRTAIAANGVNEETPEKTAGQPDARVPAKGAEMDLRKVDAAKLPATHVVAPGETYRKIARMYYKDASQWQRILDANGVPQKSLRVGQRLTIPALAAPPAKQSAP